MMVVIYAAPAPGQALNSSSTTADAEPTLSLARMSHMASLRIDKTRVETYGLSSRKELERLKGRLDELIEEQAREGSAKDKADKKQLRALNEASRLAGQALAQLDKGPDSPDLRTILTHLNVMIEAYGLGFLQPIPERVSLIEMLGYLAETVATGAEEPVNRTPQDSPFWTNPGNIPGKNLLMPVTGDLINLTGIVCKYDGPKEGFGIKGGFTIDCGKKKTYKFKVGSETNTEPFASRIYNALGYNVPTVEYTPAVEVKYVREIISEFNLNEPLRSEVTIFGIGVYPFEVGRYLNPFYFIRSAKLKNGATVSSGKELCRRLIKNCPDWDENNARSAHSKAVKIELKDAQYDETFEKSIETVTTVEGSLDVKVANQDSAGPWDWNNPAYGDLREVRGAAVVSMWLGNYDVRWDNNRVILQEDKEGRVRLKMFINDVGGGLGLARNTILANNSEANSFAWTFTAGRDDRHMYSSGGLGSVDVRLGDHGFAVVDYLPNSPNLTFNRITRADARWAAALIAQLTEDQIKTALIAAGYDDANVFLLTQKLLNRREHLLRDTGLRDETQRRLERYHSYRPATDGKMSAKLPDGTTVVARDGRCIVADARIQCPRDSASAK
jgi:hypothetical protein